MLVIFVLFGCDDVAKCRCVSVVGGLPPAVFSLFFSAACGSNVFSFVTFLLCRMQGAGLFDPVHGTCIRKVDNLLRFQRVGMECSHCHRARLVARFVF